MVADILSVFDVRLIKTCFFYLPEYPGLVTHSRLLL